MHGRQRGGQRGEPGSCVAIAVAISIAEQTSMPVTDDLVCVEADMRAGMGDLFPLTRRNRLDWFEVMESQFERESGNELLALASVFVKEGGDLNMYAG